MKLRLLAGALALALSFVPASAQVNPGTSPLSIQKGGTGAATLANHGFVLGHGTGSLTAIACTSAQLAIGQAAADPICQTVTGDVTISAAGVTAIGASKVTNSQLATMAANTTKCNATGGAANPTDCNAATMRTNMGVVIGTNVEAWDADLDCIAALSSTGVISRTGAGTCSAGALALSGLATGTQDTLVGYFGSTTASATAINNCASSLTYSTATHTFGCNALVGSGDVTGPASATDNAAARFDSTTGKLIKNSPLIIADTTGALSRSGGTGIAVQGSAGVASAAGYIGETVSNTVTAGSPVALTDNVDAVWNTLSISAGCWLVGGNVGIIGTSGSTVATHMHADHNITGSTTIQASPGGGSTTALHITSNQSNLWIFPLGWVPYCVGSTTTVRYVLIANFSGGTAGAYGVAWAVRIN